MSSLIELRSLRMQALRVKEAIAGSSGIYSKTLSLSRLSQYKVNKLMPFFLLLVFSKMGRLNRFVGLSKSPFRGHDPSLKEYGLVSH